MFDLKGSFYKRYSKEGVLKDLNFIEMGIKMDFNKQDRVSLLENIKKDTKWLDRRRLIDYSLLVGIEKIGDVKK